MSSARMMRTFGRVGSAAAAVNARTRAARRLNRDRGTIRYGSEVVAAPTECTRVDVGRNGKVVGNPHRGHGFAGRLAGGERRLREGDLRLSLGGAMVRMADGSVRFLT